MSYEADEYCRLYQRVIRKARKPHVCYACGRLISPRHYYCSVRIVGPDGDAETLKRCGRCETMHRHLAELGAKHNMWPAERLDCGRDYAEEWGEEPPGDMQALAFVTEDEAGALLKGSGGER